MKMKILIITLTMILAFSSVLGSSESLSFNRIMVQENPLYVQADGFLVSIDTTKPGVVFHSENNTTEIFSVSYLYIFAYNVDISSPTYYSDLSSAAWMSTFNSEEEEDGTRTVVTMSTMVDMKSDAGSVDDWGKLTFKFLIITKGERAQLGISLKIEGMKALPDVSHLALAQKLKGDATLMLDENRMVISEINYRWESKATVKMGYESIESDVSSYYSDDMLYLVYPYSQNMVEISHYSGEIEFGKTAVIRDYFSEIVGYGTGILLGSLALGLPYATYKKRRKSPFDMDSPLYRK